VIKKKAFWNNQSPTKPKHTTQEEDKVGNKIQHSIKINHQNYPEARLTERSKGEGFESRKSLC